MFCVVCQPNGNPICKSREGDSLAPGFPYSHIPERIESAREGKSGEERAVGYMLRATGQ